MIVPLLLAAALAGQPAPPAGLGSLGRFVVCPGNARCPARPTPALGAPVIGAGITFATNTHHRRAPQGTLLFFDPGGTAIAAGSVAGLEALRAWLVDNPDSTVVLEGHADGAGPPAESPELAGGRASAAASWLVEHGIAAGRIVAISWGTTDFRALLVGTNADPNRARRSVVATVRAAAD